MIKTLGLSERQLISLERLRSLIDKHCDGKQSVLVQRTGINKALISQYLHCKNSMGFDTAVQIGNVFSINPLWLMGYDVPDTVLNAVFTEKIAKLNQEGQIRLMADLDRLLDDPQYRKQ